MKISVLQMPVAIGMREENEAVLRRMMDAAMKDAPDVVVLPELWDIGFFPRPLEKYLDEDGARSQALLSSLAKEHGVNLVGGSVAVHEEGAAENRSYVFDRTGALVASYDKTHLFSPAKEDRFFRKGDHTAVFSLDGVTCGLMICYDLRFPELCRRLALEGAEIVFLPAAWPTARIEHWRVLSRARAIENQIFVVACNESGTGADNLQLAGHSAIIDPWGEILAQAGERENILQGTLRLAVRQQIKENMDVFADRRERLYTPKVPIS